MTVFFSHPRPEAGNRVEIRGVPLDVHNVWLVGWVVAYCSWQPYIRRSPVEVG